MSISILVYLNNFGNHTRDFTYIKDVCEIMYRLMNLGLKKSHQVFNICSNKPIKITSILKWINLNFDKKPYIKKRKFQLADVKKTHGNNAKINKYIKKNKYYKAEEALNNTCSWYKKYWKVYY